MEVIEMTVGERIRNRRKDLGVSADDLAAALGLSRSTIFRYENGDIEKLPISILEPIARKLCTTPKYLMGWTDDPDDGRGFAETSHLQEATIADKSRDYANFMDAIHAETGGQIKEPATDKGDGPTSKEIEFIQLWRLVPEENRSVLEAMIEAHLKSIGLI
jgi:transcriptional regulator with XRE-family HTH domain